MPLLERLMTKIGSVIINMSRGTYIPYVVGDLRIYLDVDDLNTANDANGFSEFFNIFIDQFINNRECVGGLHYFATLIVALILTGKMKVKCAECNRTYEIKMVCGCKIPIKRGINQPLIWNQNRIYREALKLLVNGCKSYIIIPDQDWDGTLL